MVLSFIFYYGLTILGFVFLSGNIGPCVGAYPLRQAKTYKGIQMFDMNEV